MTVYVVDGLHTFGSQEVVEIPSAGPQAANDSTKKAPLGILYRHKGNVFRYVYHAPGTAVATVAGGVAFWKSLDPVNGLFTVSSDETDTIAGINGVAGIYGCVVTATYYTWIQVGGVVTALTAAGTVASDKCIGAVTDTIFGRIAAGGACTDVVFGIALSARNGTDGTNTVLLQNLDW
jgi:hypothetical protein